MVRRRRMLAAIGCALACALAGTTALAAIEVLPSSAEKTASPGGFVTHVFVVRNSDTAPVTVKLTAQVPSGWSALGVPPSLGIGAEGEETVFVTVAVPAAALAGRYELQLAAASSTDPLDVSVASSWTEVAPVNEIEIDAPIGASVAPGDAYAYELIIINRGNAQDSVRVTATSSHAFPVELSEVSVDLAPQERSSLRVTLRVPDDASAGRDLLRVEAQSAVYEGVGDEVTLFTSILPPRPETVGGLLIEELPARLRLSVSKDVLTGAFASRMSVSVYGDVGDGTFAASFSGDSPLGPAPFFVTSYAVEAELAPASVRLGALSRHLTDLLAISCQGGDVELDLPSVSASLVGGLSGSEAAAAAAIGAAFGGVHLGLAYFGTRDSASPVAVNAATVAGGCQPFTDLVIRSEAGLAATPSGTQNALSILAEYDGTSYFLTGQAYAVDPYFPSALADRSGVRLSQRLRMDALSLSLSLAHERTNPRNDPLGTTSISDDLGFNLSLAPVADGPDFLSVLEFAWERNADPSSMDEVDLLATCSVSQTEGVMPYSFSGTVQDRIDRAFTAHTRTLSFTEGVGLSIDSLTLSLELEQERVVDVIAGNVLSSTSDVSFTFRPAAALHEATIDFENRRDNFDLGISFIIHFSADFSILVNGSIAWSRTDPDDVSFGWEVTLDTSFQLPLPFLLSKGRITGRMFVDVNQDGTFDDGDRAVSQAVVSANGIDVSTNEDGQFRFPPMYPGIVSLTARQLPPDAAAPAPLTVQVEAGKVLTFDLPLAPVLTISGTVFLDENQNGAWESGESGLPDVRVILSGGNMEERAATTDSTGRFVFFGAQPGAYTLSIDPNSLPARFVFTTPETLDIVAELEGTAPSVFGGYVRPREVVITFQPPTADIAFSPDPAVVGEPVTFDGTGSFDFDGTIETYAWDFNADGFADSTEAVSTWTFDLAGDAVVELTVADNAGNEDSLTITVPVRAPSADEAQPAAGGTDAEAQAEEPPTAVIAFSPDAPVAGQPVLFDASGSHASDPRIQIATYGWDFDGDGTLDSGYPRTSWTFVEPGPADVTLTVVDDRGLEATAALTIEIAAAVAAVPPPSARATYVPAEPTVGQSVTFDASGSTAAEGEITAYAWDFGDDGTVDAAQASVVWTFDSAGQVPVRLTVTDRRGAQDSVVLTVDVGAAPPPDKTPAEEEPSAQEEAQTPASTLPPVADFTYSPDTPVAGEPVEFNGLFSFDFDGVIVAYAWDFDGDGTVDSTQSVVVHVFPSPGSYNVNLTVTDDGGNPDTATRKLTVQ